MHGFFYRLMNRILIIITLIVAPFILFGQEEKFQAIEKELNDISLEIVNNESDEAKEKANVEFISKLKEAINVDGSFDYGFKKIQAISILSSNNTIKLYNWTLPYKDQTFKYFAILQVKAKKGFKVVEFTDKSDKLTKVESKSLTPKTWFGALYYKIIHNKKLGKSTYTLLGWDGNDNLTNRKIIDVMTVSPSGAVRFGSPILKVGKKNQKRILFTYSETAVMSLKYHDNIKMLVFDYLVPPSSNLSGVFEYYGPALNRFDGFSIGKGKWLYEKDVNIQLGRNLKDNLWVDPKK